MNYLLLLEAGISVAGPRLPLIVSGENLPLIRDVSNKHHGC